MPREREKRQRRVAGMGRRVVEHSSGDRKSLNIPEGVALFTPKKEGTYKVDLVPYEVGKKSKEFLKNYADVGDLYVERTFFTHRSVGPNQDSVVCLARTYGKPCPICEHRAKLMKDPKADEDLIKDLAPKERQLFLVYDHNDTDKGVQLWEISFHNFGKHLDKKINNADPEDRDKYRNFYDPEDGYTLKLAASEESMGKNKFLEFGVDEFRKREALDDDVVNHGVCLDDVPNQMSYEALKELFLGVGGDDEDEPEEAEEPAPKKKPGRAKPADAEPEEPEEEEEPEEAEEGDETEHEFTKGDLVTFSYKNKVKTGEVVRVNKAKGLAEVACGDTKPAVVDLTDLVLADEEPEEVDEPEEEEEPTPPKKGGKAKPAADDDGWGDDDEVPEPEEEEEEPEEEEPAPKKPAGKTPPKKPGRR